ncbi:DUF1659 domain-containing protein [Sporosarcina sp. FSL W7-1349]|uniref:DUF1659 domain-containing protein n=1 Tax=Sporosarcina sp. FSL W7-1349 TaxID=2921561 RepID=UPI0030F9F6D4
MATIEFKSAIGRVHFDGGMTEEGKLIRKSKSYRHIAENVTADNLYTALNELASLSSLPFIGAEKVETSEVYD